MLHANLQKMEASVEQLKKDKDISKNEISNIERAMTDAINRIKVL